MIFYTADTHFGFYPIIHATARPFSSVQEMDAAIIRNWNDAVSPDDTVYILGDFAYDKGDIPDTYFRVLNGKKHLIRGNHDASLDHQERFFEFCESVTDFLETDDGDDHIIMSHYPMVHNKKSYMIHGHIHNKRGPGYEILKTLPHVLNAGVDINFFRPVTLKELIRNNEMFYSEKYPELFPDPDIVFAGETPEEKAFYKNWSNEHFRPLSYKKPDFRPLPVRPD